MYTYCRIQESCSVMKPKIDGSHCKAPFEIKKMQNPEKLMKRLQISIFFWVTSSFVTERFPKTPDKNINLKE